MPPLITPISLASRRFPRIALALAGLLAIPLSLPAQAPRFAIAGWSTEDGLPSNVARGIQQTPDGYLWLASYEGLVRFDGVAFRSFTEAEIPGLSRASFRRLAVDPRGVLWAAAETGGLVRMERGRWRVYTTRDGLKSDRLTALRVDADGSLWVGTRGGVNRIVGDRVTALPPPPGGEPAVTALARDDSGAVWIGTVADGLLRYADGRYTRITRAEGLDDDRVTALSTDRAGGVWIGTFAGVMRMRQGRLTRTMSAAGAASGPVNELLQDPDGSWWVAADNGLFRLADGVLTPVPQGDGRAFTQVEGMHLDREGSLWIGSRQRGLFRVRRASVGMLTAADGLPHDFVAAVNGDRAGMWIATRAGLHHRGPAGVRSYTAAGGALRDEVVRDVLTDRQGDVWAATNSGLTRIRGGQSTTFTARDGLPDDRARVLLEDRAGALWIGTYDGLARLHQGRFTQFGAADGLPDGYVLSLFEDRAGTLWVGTQSAGLFRRTARGFARGPAALAGQPIFRITQDQEGTLWVGTTRGLVRLRGDATATVATRQGLPGNTIYQALDDGHGALWLTGPWGIARVSRAELNAVADGRERTVNAKVFGISDGLVAREASSIGRSWRAPDGTLAFATPAGVALIDPRRLPRNDVPPQIHLERVVSDDVGFEAGTPVDLPPGRDRLEFHYNAPSFVAPAQLRFRYQLEGYDEGWVDGGNRRAAYYTSLPPGRYTFRVQARNEDGVWSAAAATASVRLRPYFWQTTLFLVLATLGLGALALTVHRLRVRAAELATREEVLRAMSLRDELTGLYNRRGLLALAEQQMDHAVRTGIGFDVLFVDMDGMKEINDGYGHAVGDRALVDAAALLRATFRRSDVVARLGGDEFAVLVVGRTPGEPSQSDVAAERLYQAVDRHNASSRRPYRLSLSAGASRFDPAAPSSLDELLEAADQQMYIQKRVKAAVRA